jgi:peptidoglycan hydrolase CwlO-like protein
MFYNDFELRSKIATTNDRINSRFESLESRIRSLEFQNGVFRRLLKDSDDFKKMEAEEKIAWFDNEHSLRGLRDGNR